VKGVITALLLISAVGAISQNRTTVDGPAQPIAKTNEGVVPVSAYVCPTSHPIKGNFTTHNRERCIAHSPGGAFYHKTKPERCYVSTADAAADGCRPSKR
jgi:hypothetical protein